MVKLESCANGLILPINCVQTLKALKGLETGPRQSGRSHYLMRWMWQMSRSHIHGINFASGFLLLLKLLKLCSLYSFLFYLYCLLQITFYFFTYVLWHGIFIPILCRWCSYKASRGEGGRKMCSSKLYFFLPLMICQLLRIFFPNILAPSFTKCSWWQADENVLNVSQTSTKCFGCLNTTNTFFHLLSSLYAPIHLRLSPERPTIQFFSQATSCCLSQSREEVGGWLGQKSRRLTTKKGPQPERNRGHCVHVMCLNHRHGGHADLFIPMPSLNLFDSNRLNKDWSDTYCININPML